MTSPDMPREIGTLQPIGWVSSSLRQPGNAPRQPDEGAPTAKLSIEPEAMSATHGLRAGDRIVIVTWLHLADRSTRDTRPRDDPDRDPIGVFATRSPDRPNPIGLHETTIVAVSHSAIEVSELEAVDGTPILDIKPVIGRVSER